MKKLFKIPKTPLKEAKESLLSEIKKDEKLKLTKNFEVEKKNLRLNWELRPRKIIGRCQKRRTPYIEPQEMQKNENFSKKNFNGFYGYNQFRRPGVGFYGRNVAYE